MALSNGSRSLTAQLHALWTGFVTHQDASQEEEAAFQRHAATLTTRGMMVMCVLTSAALLVSWPTDFVIFADSPVMIEANMLWRSVALATCGVWTLWAWWMGPRMTRALALGSVVAGTIVFFAFCGHAGGMMGGFDSPFFYPVYVMPTFSMAALYVPLLTRLVITSIAAASFVAAFLGFHPQHLEYPYIASPLVLLSASVMLCSLLGHMVYHLSRRNFFQTRDLRRAHEQAETLLLNILPHAIADRLKQSQQPIADAHPNVTVLFADIVGFTPLSSMMEPQALVGMLNLIFSDFDRIAERHGLEKIKTIGDAYMVAGGLPQERPDHALAVTEMALEMLEVIKRYKTPGGGTLDMRIGINSGPVVAGVIGMRKFIYDVWGDAVNTASRMESHGASGRIHVSASTRELLGDRYLLEDRGEIEVKGKGRMRAYFLVGRRAEAVKDGRATAPAAEASAG